MKCLLLLAVANAALAFDYDTNVCTPNTLGSPAPGEPTRPDFKDLKSFQTRVEANIQELNVTVEFDEFFDFDQNIGSATEYEPPAQKEKAIYNYKTNELIVASIWRQTCTVEDLSTSRNRFLFGYKKINGTGHIYTVQGALRYDRDNVNEIYKGDFMVRGIKTDRWDSCLKWDDQRATIKLSWYFSDAEDWTSALAVPQVPVRAVAWGTIMKPDGVTKDHDFYHSYEFTQFRPALLDDVYEALQTPKGMICPGRKNTKPLPTPPSTFQMHSEVVQPEYHMIGYVQEFYDYRAKLARYDYKPLPINTNLEFGTNPLSEVHDFNTGVRYIMDTHLGNCSWRPLSAGAFDARSVDATTVRIRTAKEIFDFDSTNYTYSGIRQVRDIMADVWITKRSDFPATLNVNSTFEWYFARPDWLENSMMDYEFGEPVRLEITIDPPLNIHTIYNIYNFNEDRPSFWNYDISLCFTYLARTQFEFSLPGQFRGVVDVNLELFKYFVLLSITGTTAISPLRVANMVIDYDEDNIIVKFTMLEKAPIAGNTRMTKEEVPLNVASEVLKETIDHGQFIVEMIVETEANPVQLVAKQYSLKSQVWINGVDPNTTPSTDTSTKYTPAIAATVGVIMTIVGLLAGAIAAFFFFK